MSESRGTKHLTLTITWQGSSILRVTTQHICCLHKNANADVRNVLSFNSLVDNKKWNQKFFADLYNDHISFSTTSLSMRLWHHVCSSYAHHHLTPSLLLDNLYIKHITRTPEQSYPPPAPLLPWPVWPSRPRTPWQLYSNCSPTPLHTQSEPQQALTTHITHSPYHSAQTTDQRGGECLVPRKKKVRHVRSPSPRCERSRGAWCTNHSAAPRQTGGAPTNSVPAPRHQNDSFHDPLATRDLRLQSLVRVHALSQFSEKSVSSI